MPLTKKIQRILYDKPPIIFHDHFGKFAQSMDLIQFVNSYSGDAFHSVFADWSNENTKTLADLDSKSKKEFEKVLKMKKKRPKLLKKYSIKSVKVQKLLAKNAHQSFIFHNIPIFVNESCITNIVTLFENFLKSTMTLIITKNPRSLMQSNKEFRIKDVGASKTYDDILSIAISKEIEAVIDGGIDQICDYFKKHGLDLEKIQDWRKFREVFLRRNIIVHNSGYPNDKYWEKMKKKAKSTNRLTVTHSYVNNSIKLFDSFAHAITDYFEVKYTPKNIFSHSNPMMSTSPRATFY